MENLQNTEMENEVMPQKVENAQNEQREITKDFCGNYERGAPIEMACMAFVECGLISCMFIELMWLKGIIAVVCAVIFSVPVVVRVMRRSNSIDVEKVIEILRKRGFQPAFKDGEIRWMVNGKECILRIHSHCQVEISREYGISSAGPVIVKYERAAMETMKEVYLAKVAVKKQGESSLLAFSTESLCTSSKEFMTYLPMCLDILDLAESRQQVHIKEAHDGAKNGSRKRIGFKHPDGTIR